MFFLKRILLLLLLKIIKNIVVFMKHAHCSVLFTTVHMLVNLNNSEPTGLCNLKSICMPSCPHFLGKPFPN